MARSIIKSVFVKGVTDDKGKLSFVVERDYADLDENDWAVKVEQLVIQVTSSTPPSTVTRPISCSVNFCNPLQSSAKRIYPGPDRYYYTTERQPVKLALAVIKGEKDEFVSLSSESSEFISFRFPPSSLELTLRNEMTEAPCPQTPVIAHLFITRRS